RPGARSARRERCSFQHSRSPLHKERTMSRVRTIRPATHCRPTPTPRAPKCAARPQRKPWPGCPLRLLRLEDRVTPSVNPAAPLELDGNVTHTTAHDWDQVFANAAGALAASFVTDKVNTTADDIFTGGGSKDTQGIQ